MQSYTDNQDQEWRVELNGWTLRKVRDNAGVLLTALFEDNAKLYADLYSDPILLADVVWAFIEDQAKERDITQRNFAESFTGDMVERAREAVVEATIDFFESQETREQLRVLKEKILSLSSRIRTEAKSQLAEVDLNSVDMNSLISSSN